MNLGKRGSVSRRSERRRISRDLAVIVAASTLWAGCSGGSPNRQTVAAALVATPPAVTQFVLLAEGSATFGDRDAVNGGDVGLTAGTLTSGFDSHLGVGETILAPSVV